MQNNRRVHYVLSTHWDREWYQSFQDFRFRLVHMLDQILEGIQDETLQGPFQTDGQVIMLEDYLEIRPEKQQLIETLLQNGRLVAGPWYVLPDEFTVSGESLIRNLRYGRELVRKMGGKPSNAGFLCDMFGHISQMPQILEGFGISAAFVWRGTNLIEKRLALWTGADGTEISCVRFGQVGYCDYAFRIRRANEPDWKFTDEETLAEDLERYANEEALLTETDALLFFDGGDHQEWDKEIYRVFTKWMNWQGQQFSVQHTSLDSFLEEMVQQKDKISTTFQGELRQPGKYPIPVDQQWIIPGVLSSRVNLKLANHLCQILLCQWAEPLTAFAEVLTGVKMPSGYLDTAWRWLLQNHPHDSIDGCSIDQVHRDMLYRFDQSRQISNRLLIESSRTISANIAGTIGENEVRLTVFNPLARTYQGIIEVDLQIPPEWATFNEFFGYEPKPAFQIFDASGEVIPYQRITQKGTENHLRPIQAKFWPSITANVVRVALPVIVPATGYTTLTIRSGEAGIPTRYPETPGLGKSDCEFENEFLQVKINSNGSLTITDKRSKEQYDRLLVFEDMADIGDGWYHGQPVNDQVIYSTGCQAEIACISNGPFLVQYIVRIRMTVPEEFLFNRMIRSDRQVNLVIDNTLTLRKGQDYLEVTSEIENIAGDHRLRVLFTTSIAAKTYLADSAFDVVERPVALIADNHLYRELEVETRPQQSWTAIFNKQRGLAIIADGLLETAIRDVPEHPIALTLFRATRRTVMTNGEADGQMQGEMSFHYYVLPFSGTPDRTRLSELGSFLAGGCHIEQLTNKDLPYYQKQANLPSKAGMFELTGQAIVTSARMTKTGFEIRMFNPWDDSIQVELNFNHLPKKKIPWRKFRLVNFDSAPLSEDQPCSERITFVLAPKKILTVALS